MNRKWRRQLNRIVLAGVLTFGLACAGNATAQPVLGQKVYDPYVKKGVTEIETRWAQLRGKSGAGETGGVIELEHGVNDRISLDRAAS